jgi:hypothetical protein
VAATAAQVTSEFLPLLLEFWLLCLGSWLRFRSVAFKFDRVCVCDVFFSILVFWLA